MINYKLQNILFQKLIENEINSYVTNISVEDRELLRIELTTKFNLYKSYSKRINNFWVKYEKYLHSKQWKELRESVFKRDNYQCVLCGAKANHCHHLTYGAFVKFGESKRLECISLCKSCHEEVHGHKI